MFRASLFALILALPSLAYAQAPQASPHDLLKAAYLLRRQGKYKQACAAFESLLRMLKKSPFKKPIALETADLYKVMGDERKALLLYRRNRDTTREIETLLNWKGPKPADRLKEALTVARLVKNARGEALALVKLGKTAQAIQIFKAQGLHRDHAELLMAQKSYIQAADLFYKASAFFEQGEALELAGKAKEAKRAFEDAAEKIKYRLKEETLPAVKKTRREKKVAEKAGNANRREKARHDLAARYGDLSRDFQRWAKCLSVAGDPKRAVKAASSALKHARKQKALLEDGDDLYGKAAVETLFGLSARLKALEGALTQYQQALPKAPNK